MLQIVAETPQGWMKCDAACLGDRVARWNMDPGAANALTLALPTNVTRWKLIFSARKAGMRERVARQLIRRGALDSKGFMRSVMLWFIRRLPNRPGRSLQFESDMFELRTTPSYRPYDKSVEPDRRPASPFHRGRHFVIASCAPPSVSAAVAHLIIKFHQIT